MGTILDPRGATTREVVLTVAPKALETVVKRLDEFLRPYLPLFGQSERRVQAKRAVQGLLSRGGASHAAAGGPGIMVSMLAALVMPAWPAL